MNKKKLELEILDSKRNVVVSHNFCYEANHGNRLRLTINDNVYIMDCNGKFVIMSQEDFEPETLYEDAKQIVLNILSDELNKDNKLPLKVWTVCYRNPFVGNKGNALYITLEARSSRCAQAEAMANKEFRNHIYMKYFDEKYLEAYAPCEEYELGKIEYFEGDPRL